MLYEEFVKGAKDGLKTVVGILPTLIGLMVAVGVLRASGFLDMLGELLGKFTAHVGFPAELVPLSDCTDVFFQRRYRPGTGYFPGIRHRFPCRTYCVYYDVPHRNDFLHDFCIFYCCKSEQNQVYGVGGAAGFFCGNCSQCGIGGNDVIEKLLTKIHHNANMVTR